LEDALSPSARTTLSEALNDFRRAWPQLVVTALLARILAVVIITPAISLLVKLFLWRTASGVVTDEAILAFFLHPFGLAALIIVAAVTIAIRFAESGQLMVIGFGAAEDRRVSWLRALVYAYRRAPALMRIAGTALLKLLPIAAPFLAVVGGIYWLLVRTHDVNYYLAEKPPEFVAALVSAGILLAAVALIVTSKVAVWLLSVPMVLFENTGGRRALRASERASRDRRWKFTVWLVGWLLGIALVSVVVTTVSSWLGRLVVSLLGSSLTALVLGLGLVILLAWLANLAISVFASVLFALLVTRLYRFLAGPGELRPEISPPGSLGDRPPFRVPGKLLIASAVALLAIAVVSSLMVVDDPDWEDPTQIIAHRGGAWVAPENTVAAFERAISDGADWLELDVQENANGEVVVEHDRDFMRAAGVPLEVWQATNADLAKIDIGSAFAPEFSDQRVPTLREVLQLARGKAGVFIELKYYGRSSDLERKVVELVEETGMASDIVIMSLKYEGIQKMAALRPDWTYGLLNAVAIGDLTRLDVDFLALTAGATRLGMIRRTHRRGMKIYPWTINDPVQMWVMMSRGVDGIITDRVAMAKRVTELRAEVTPLGRFILWMAGELDLLRGAAPSSSEEDA
jgi:glycerophosphoryl diester phosphodiesterase